MLNLQWFHYALCCYFELKIILAKVSRSCCSNIIAGLSVWYLAFPSRGRTANLFLEVEGCALQEGPEQLVRIPRQRVGPLHAVEAALAVQLAHQEPSAPGGLQKTERRKVNGKCKGALIHPKSQSDR